jgi:hypothetical protein
MVILLLVSAEQDFTHLNGRVSIVPNSLCLYLKQVILLSILGDYMHSNLLTQDLVS